MEHSNSLKHMLVTALLLLAATVWIGCRPSSRTEKQQRDEAVKQQATARADRQSPRPSQGDSRPPGKPDIYPPGWAEPEAVLKSNIEPQGDAPPESEGEGKTEPQPPREREAEPRREGERETNSQPERERETELQPEGERDPEPIEGADLDPPDVSETEPADEIEPWDEPQPVEVRDLGLPLVDDLDRLKKIDKTRPLWADEQNKRLIMVGEVCQTGALLELFACLKGTKEHEAVLTVDVRATLIHAWLLLFKAKVGGTARWVPEYRPASGTEIEVTVVWKDDKGKRRTARAQDWVRDARSGKPMTHPWVFAGSGFWKNEETGKEFYQAQETGDFICVSNFTTALLDVPIESSQTNEALMFEAFTERIPPRGTPVTLILKPKLEKAE